MIEPVIFAGLRTAIGTAGHALKELTVAELAAAVLRPLGSLIDDHGLRIDDVIMGNCLGPGGNPARVAALRAGLGVDIPGVSVDRQCGSGLEAISQAAAKIRAQQGDLMIAGGAESASTAPWRFWPPVGGEEPVRYTRAPFAPPGFPDPEMGPAADAVAAQLNISRESQDAWAARSHRRATEAREAGYFAAELVALGGLDHDQRVRDNLTAERLARLRPAFSVDGTVTAGNSCGISDGAAFVAMSSAKVWSVTGLPGLRILASAVSAGDPALPGLGAGMAINQLLGRAGVRPGDVQAIEVTEAFASQVIATVQTAGLDEGVVCADGGALAYGHPWGASGAILVVRLLHRLLREPGGSGLGLAACAIGGGQGIALLVERIG